MKVVETSYGIILTFLDVNIQFRIKCIFQKLKFWCLIELVTAKMAKLSDISRYIEISGDISWYIAIYRDISPDILFIFAIYHGKNAWYIAKIKNISGDISPIYQNISLKNRNFAIYHDFFVFWYKSLYRFSIYHRNFIEISWFFINISVKLIYIDISFPVLIYHFPEYIKKYAKNMRYIFDISEIFWVRKYFFEIIFQHLNFDISENIVFYEILW